MKITKLPGYIITDVAYEYYKLLGKEKDRMQAKKNFLNLKKHDLALINQSMAIIYRRNFRMITKAMITGKLEKDESK